jgi:hypothetical protein
MKKLQENMQKQHELALGRFMQQIAECHEMLTELQEFVDNHMEFAPDEISWSHVGTASWYLERLKELVDHAYNRGEFAE